MLKKTFYRSASSWENSLWSARAWKQKIMSQFMEFGARFSLIDSLIHDSTMLTLHLLISTYIQFSLAIAFKLHKWTWRKASTRRDSLICFIAINAINDPALISWDYRWILMTFDLSTQHEKIFYNQIIN